MSYMLTVHKLNDSVYGFEEIKSIWQYLILGEKAALLVDTGFGFTDALRRAVDEITRLPLIVVNTHGDIDHVCGNYLFGEAYISRADYKQLPGLNDPDFRKSQLLCRITWPGSQMLTEMSRAELDKWIRRSIWESEFHFLEDDQQFDLGGRIVQAIAIPGHTPGSMAFLDDRSGFLFSGDMLTAGASHFLVPLPQYGHQCEPLPVLCDSLKRLKSFQSEITAIYGGHGDVGRSSEIIDLVLETVQAMIIDPMGNTERTNWTGTSVLERKAARDPKVSIEISKQLFELFALDAQNHL